MKAIFRFLIALCFLFPGLSMAVEQTPELYFFGDNYIQPVNLDLLLQRGVKVQVFNLEDHANLERELSEGLPVHDLERAKALAQARLAQLPVARLQAAFAGPLKAQTWKITKIPAVVFGQGEQVIYDVTNLQQAYDLWRNRALSP